MKILGTRVLVLLLCVLLEGCMHVCLDIANFSPGILTIIGYVANQPMDPESATMMVACAEYIFDTLYRC